MAQCQKILEDGQRCSNRAVPGQNYCDQHQAQQRIKFRPVPKIPSVPSPAEPAPVKTRPTKQQPAKKPAPPPDWVAHPSAAGDSPAFPGLHSDARHILVAPQAVIWLGAATDEEQPVPLPARLERLLAGLSQETPLPGAVTIRLAPEGAGALVSLAPAQPEQVDLSRLYDAAADAAAFSGGLLYIGQGRAFIQYRDGSAPHGYDAPAGKLPAGDDLYLVDREGTHPISPRALTTLPLDEFLLGLPLLPEPGAKLPETAFALVAPALYRLLARYFRDHHLRYRLARFHAAPGGQTFVLFEIAPRPEAPTGAQLPAFVLAYLQGLPQVTVLTEVWAEAGRRMLVEWRRRHPCLPGHILEAFPPDSLVISTADPDFRNLCVNPTPPFFEGDELTLVQPSRPTQAQLTPVTQSGDLPFELAVRLGAASGPTPATAALILDNQEFEWLRRLLFRLPGEAFAAYQLCVGRQQAILLSETRPLEGLPFGLPLRRVQDTQLFVPLRRRFVPDLSWSLLAEALALQPGQYTFLTESFRLDVARTDFAPLSRTLVAAGERPRLNFALRPAPELPRLVWTPPAQLDPEQRGHAPAQAGKSPGGQPQPGFLERLLGRSPQQPSGPAEEPPPAGRRAAKPEDTAAVLRRQAETYQQQGDFLEAALCFMIMGDQTNAARCYRQAAQQTV